MNNLIGLSCPPSLRELETEQRKQAEEGA